MLNKRGIELSINFIVILIITIIIFGFGIRFITQLSSQANKLQELTVQQLDERIGELICDKSDRVCVGVERKIIRKNSFDVFGVKILNILDDRYFDVRVFPSNPQGYQKDNTEISNSEPKLVINPPITINPRSIFIKKNEERSVGIGIEVPGNAKAGTYILNIEIKQNGELYVPLQKLYVDVP